MRLKGKKILDRTAIDDIEYPFAKEFIQRQRENLTRGRDDLTNMDTYTQIPFRFGTTRACFVSTDILRVIKAKGMKKRRDGRRTRDKRRSASERAREREGGEDEKAAPTVSPRLFRLFDIGRVSPRQYRANN